MKHRWLIFRFLLLNLMKWKPLVKMKLVAYLSLGIKVWDILFYLPGESDVGALSLDFGGVMLFMVRDVLETHWRTFPHDFIEIGWIELKLNYFYLAVGTTFFLVSGCDQLQKKLAKHYVQFVPMSEHAFWVVEFHLILMF